MAKILINDQIINELAFDVLFHLSQPDKKSLLSPGELRATRTAKKAIHYANQMSIDEKLILFAKIGISYSLVIHNKGWKLKDWIKKTKDLTNAQKMTEAAKIKLVVVSNKDIINNLSVMANLTHSDTFLLNMDFHRVGHFVNAWKDRKPNEGSLQDSLEDSKIINKLALVTSLAIKAIRGNTEIGDLDINILMFLYDNRKNYVTREVIDGFLGSQYRKQIITAAVQRLVEKELIERNPTITKPEYQITGTGIRSVMDFHSKNLQSV